MDNATFKADCRTRLAAELREGKLAEIIRRAEAEREVREPDWEALDAKRRERAEISERRYNCPRGEYR